MKRNGTYMQDQTQTVLKETTPAEDEQLQSSPGSGESDQTPEVDYKKKFANSTRENQVLMAKLKKLEQKLDQLSITAPVTEQELSENYPDWDEFTQSEQKLLRELHALKKSKAESDKQLITLLEKEETQQALKEAYVSFPQLKEHKGEFIKYINKPTHKGAPIPVLARSFLFEGNSSQSTAPVKTNSSVGLESGHGGLGTRESDTQTQKRISLTEDEIRAASRMNISLEDYAKYKSNK